MKTGPVVLAFLSMFSSSLLYSASPHLLFQMTLILTLFCVLRRCGVRIHQTVASFSRRPVSPLRLPLIYPGPIRRGAKPGSPADVGGGVDDSGGTRPGTRRAPDACGGGRGSAQATAVDGACRILRRCQRVRSVECLCVCVCVCVCVVYVYHFAAFQSGGR